MGPNEQEIRAILLNHHPSILKVFKDAWNEWIEVSNFRSVRGYSPVQYPRTVANYVFDAVARNAIQIFGDGDSGVRVWVESQTIKLVIEEKVIGRFKKGDENHLGRNIQTGAVLEFINQELPIPGMPSRAAKVEFIYRLNALGTRIQQVLVVARDRDRVIWFYPIEATESPQNVVVMPSDLTPSDPDGEQLVAARRIKKDQQKEGS